MMLKTKAQTLTFKLEEFQVLPQREGLHNGHQDPYHNLQMQKNDDRVTGYQMSAGDVWRKTRCM